MYIKHAQLAEITDRTILWKHMNLSRFLAVLVNQSLWFNRLDNFEDVYEGTFPIANRTNAISDELFAKLKSQRKHIYVACFHANKFESAAMWSLYSKEEGIAIKTTGARLKEALAIDEKPIYMCGVQYIDFEKDRMPEGDATYLAAYKRKSFEHEKEVRCIFVDDVSSPAYANEKGLNVQVDLEKLLMEIYISPYAPPYTQNTLAEILDRFGLKTKLTPSTLYTK